MSDYGPFVRTAFPDGSELFYRDSNHSYWRGCRSNPKADCGYSGTGRLTGISTVVDPFDWRPDNLMRWVERLTLEGVARGFAGEPVPADPHLLRMALETAGLRWEQIRDEAGDRGTNVHRDVLELLASGVVPDLADIPEDRRGYAQGVMRWWAARDPEPLQVEQTVFCDELGCAGRMDLRFRITDDPLLRGNVGVVDLKTGGYISTTAHVQVAGYDHSVVACGLGEPAAQLLILQVSERGEFREIPVRASHDDFRAAVEVYRRAARIGREAKADRSIAAAAELAVV